MARHQYAGLDREQERIDRAVLESLRRSHCNGWAAMQYRAGRRYVTDIYRYCEGEEPRQLDEAYRADRSSFWRAGFDAMIHAYSLAHATRTPGTRGA